MASLTRFIPVLILSCAPAPTPPSAVPDAPAEAVTWAQLPVRTAAPGPRFAELDALAQGLDFEHRFTDDPKHQTEMGGPFAGGGVALGDYDGDGLLDVFLTRSTGGGRLYRNLGDLRFDDVTTKMGIGDEGWTTGAGFVDLDGDGRLDLFVGRYLAANRVYLNRGDTFVESAAQLGLDYVGATVSMAFADYDRDGDLDAYLVTYRSTPESPISGQPLMVAGRPVPRPEHREFVAPIYRAKDVLWVNAGQRDILYRNDGGRFVDATAESGVPETHEMGSSARFFDYDDDGWPDLYVANDFFGADHLFHNVRGHFQEVTKTALPHTAWFSMGVDAGDLDNDGRLDLFTADMSGTTHRKQKVSMGDMDDDGWFLEFAQPRQYMRNAVFLNTGTPRFQEVAHLTGLDSTDWTWTARFADLDEDGRQDLFTSNGMTRDFSDSDIRARLKARGAWKDFDTEFWKTQPERRDPNLAFRNQGDLRFESVGPAWGLNAASVSFGAALGDLDGDGDLDLVTNDFQRAPRLYRNQTQGTHRLTLALAAQGKNTGAVGARVTLVGAGGRQVREVVASGGFMSTDSPLLHFGLANKEALTAHIRWPNGQEQTVQDVHADRHYTIRQAPTATPAPVASKTTHPTYASAVVEGIRHWERPFDDFARQPLLPARHSSLGPAFALGDVDGDGDIDAYLGGAAGSAGWLLMNDGGVLKAHTSFRAETESEDVDAAFFDADGDGDLDLYVVSGGVELADGAPALADRLYRNVGGVLKRDPEALPALFDSGGPLAIGDFDGDGDIDVFVGGRVVPGAYPTAPHSRLLENRDGRFVDVTDATAPGLTAAGMATAASFADLDGDGDLDLVVTYEWGPVRWWRNSDGAFEDASDAAGLTKRSGWWSALDPVDVDGDGDVDLAVGNVGLNTKYTASRAHPAGLWYGPFGAQGQQHIVEVKPHDGTHLPVRGLSCSSDAMPEINARFGTFNAFADADAEAIYGDALDAAQRFEVDTLESGVWLNDGGRFRFEPWPRRAQLAPASDIASFDYDGDGHIDLVVAQNFFGPQRETGRWDGGVGQVLRGLGDGRFEVVDPADTGVVVSGDARAVRVADLNGDACPELLFATSDGPIHRLHRPPVTEGCSKSQRACTGACR